jgi:hypothetical protein
LQPKSQAQSMTCPTNSHLRFRIAAFDPRHVVGASLAVVYVQGSRRGNAPF